MNCFCSVKDFVSYDLFPNLVIAIGMIVIIVGLFSMAVKSNNWFMGILHIVLIVINIWVIGMVFYKYKRRNIESKCLF